jgi:hypothetical protein
VQLRGKTELVPLGPPGTAAQDSIVPAKAGDPQNNPTNKVAAIGAYLSDISYLSVFIFLS